MERLTQRAGDKPGAPENSARKQLTGKQERFAQHIAGGKSPDEAYRLVYSVQHLGYSALLQNGKRLLSQAHIAARIAALKEAGAGTAERCGEAADCGPDADEAEKTRDGQEIDSGDGLLEAEGPYEVLLGVTYTDEVTVREVLNGLREVKDKCLGNLPVRTDEKGKTKTWVFHPAGANRALELLGKHVGMFEKQDTSEDGLSKLDQVLDGMNRLAKSDL